MQNEYLEGIKKDATTPTYRLGFDHSRLLNKTLSRERRVADHTSLQVRNRGFVLYSADWRGNHSKRKTSDDAFACHLCRDAIS